jgi:isopenicillin-N N-acyltransferase-like protein
MSHAPFPLVEISGPPFERGVAYGRQARQRIARSIALYGATLTGLGVGRDGLVTLVAGFRPLIEGFDPAAIVEMQGIAEGAGVAFEEIVLVNARTELLQLAKRQGRPEKDGCTGAVLLPSVTRDGRLIHGQNWDWKAECVETGIVLRIRQLDGPDVLTFTEAGGLARSGLNSLGHAITANYIESDRDYRSLGVPLPFIRRKALEAATLAEMIRVVAATPISASNCMMLSHKDGFAVAIERAPDEAFPIHAVDGILTHANHFESEAATAKLKDTSLAETPDSLYRGERIREMLCGRHGRLDAEALKAAFRDDFGAPFAVCRPVVQEGGNLGATVASIVMTPAEGLMEICPMPAEGGAFTSYRI